MAGASPPEAGLLLPKGAEDRSRLRRLAFGQVCKPFAYAPSRRPARKQGRLCPTGSLRSAFGQVWEPFAYAQGRLCPAERGEGWRRLPPEGEPPTPRFPATL
jgi:hypothetical protein